MDIGLAGVRSFMTKEPDQDLVVGQVVQCFITQCQIDGHVGTLTLSQNTTIKFKQNVELNTSTLIPGTKLHVNVRKVSIISCTEYGSSKLFALIRIDCRSTDLSSRIKNEDFR